MPKEWNYVGVAHSVYLDTLIKNYACEFYTFDKDGVIVDCDAPALYVVICKDGVKATSCPKHEKAMVREQKERQIGKGFEQGYI
jgi:hypothetical protein